MQAIHISAFEDSAIKHGGVKRSNQIREVLCESGFSTLTPPSTRAAAQRLAFGYPHLFAYYAVAWLVRSISLGLTLKGIFYLTTHTIFLHIATRNGKPNLVALELSAGHAMLIGRLISEMQVPYICFPHNIEFLVPNQRISYFRKARHAFDWESRIYRHARMNFAISDFDSSVIASLGANSAVFQYYPSLSDAERFSKISRERQLGGRSAFFLILGTVHNQPTRVGMERLLTTISSRSDMTFIVAGFGTEDLLRYENSNLKVLGGINDDALDDLLRETEGVVISHPQTSGFLTKIVDLNLCSVPIYFVTKYIQGEKMEDYGVFSVDCIDRLMAGPFAPAKPAQHFRRPTIDFCRFIDTTINMGTP